MLGFKFWYEITPPDEMTSCEWSIQATEVTLTVEVPPNTSATVVCPGRDDEPINVLSGTHHWKYNVDPSAAAAWEDRVTDAARVSSASAPPGP